jgi:Domain of unknown function (DUF3459)
MQRAARTTVLYGHRSAPRQRNEESVRTSALVTWRPREFRSYLDPELLVSGSARHSQQMECRSILWLYKKLIALRNAHAPLREGEYRPMRSHNDILAFSRASDQDEILVALNLVGQPRRFLWKGSASVLLSTYLDRDESSIKGPILLRQDEGVILKIKATPDNVKKRKSKSRPSTS